MDENRGPQIALNDEERFPLLKDLTFLKQLKQNAYAPKFNFESGDRLEQHHLEEVEVYAKDIRTQKIFWGKGQLPNWLPDYFNWCRNTVPFYKNRSSTFMDQPTIRRADLAKSPWDLVSKDCDLNDLLVYQTSGTTGPPIDVNFDPVTQACWIPQVQSILDSKNIKLSKSSSEVAIAMICSQEQTLTYASLSTYLNGSGVLKINLHPNDWNEREDAIKYLEHYNPEILTGDPFAFSALSELQPKLRPKAMISSAMKLTEGLKNKLEKQFQCWVIDVYSLTECRMIAYADGKKFKAIRPELYLEIFDKERDELLPEGAFGELVVSGGNNPFLPLIRYRTGDYCRLKIENEIPCLYDLEARKPAPMYNTKKEFVNNINISRAMMHLPLAGFEMHQSEDYALSFEAWSNEAIENDILKILKSIFGQDAVIKITVHSIEQNLDFKTVQYSSDFDL